MSYKVPKSIASGIPDFALRVAAHAWEMKQWRAHMAHVERDASDCRVAADQKHAAYPAPRDHEYVMAAVNENDVADFEIVDDDPSPESIQRIRTNFELSQSQETWSRYCEVNRSELRARTLALRLH